MATLVLSTVGTALAGPIGGLLGSLIGQSIDQQLLGGGPRKGPRLGDLNVQTSSYGTAIPRIYGTMRAAGTIIWATDLKEDSELQGDGKSQPETVIYTYSVSLAVALSSRKAAQVKRIWADGKLIRGAAGDLKVAGKFRFYRGTEDQPIDPHIGSVEGSGQSPAYRGLALAVFEDLQLGSFGNRIPALTFELVADTSSGVAIGELLNDASDQAIICADQRSVAGYAAHGDTIGGALAPLIEAFAVELHDDGSALRSPAVEVARIPANTELGASADIEGTSTVEREQASAASLPAAVTLTYYDPARDYQTGQARASCPTPSRVTRVLTLPCVLDAGPAKAMAENLLLRAWALRDRVTLRLPLSFANLQPGSPLRLPGLHGDWIAEDVEIERLVVTVTLRPAWAYPGTRSADPGRSNPQPDVVAAPTWLALFDLPDPETSQPTLALAAASPSGTWSQAPIEIEAGGVVSAGSTAVGEAVLAKLLTVLGTGQASLIDMVNSVEIKLANPDHWLQSRDDAALAMGANLAAIGSEIIQFGQAVPSGSGCFKLSRLLRGRRGSEWAMAGHAAGEDFCLLDARSLKAITLPAEMLGTKVTVTARAPGDSAAPPSVARDANGEAMRPLSPAHLRASLLADGSLALSWVRRSRLSWAWLDEVEAPNDATVDGFRIRASRGGGFVERDVTASMTSLSAAELSALGTGPVTVEVRQIGALATSRPAALTINA